MADNTPDGKDPCDKRVHRAFLSGRRAGYWLAFNGPQARQQAARRDRGYRIQQDRAIEGLGDVFGQAEQRARFADVNRRAMERIRLRREDLQAREQQDQAIEGISDVFARAERDERLRRIPRPVLRQPVREIQIPSRRELILELRMSDAPALRERLRGVTAQQLYDFYKTQPPQRESMRELATKLGIKHRAPGESTVMDARRLSQAIARHLA